MKCKIIIKSNSHYSYLWPIINDAIRHLKNVCLFVDKQPEFKFNDNVEFIFYDNSLSYTERISCLINNVKEEYFLLIHDVDIILNLNEQKLNEYLSIVIDNNIDRLSLGAFNNESSSISMNNLSVCRLDYNISKNFFTPFDYAPSVYRKSKVKEFYKKFHGETYKKLELNSCAQSYFHKNLSSYGIQKNENVELIYHRGFVYTKDFSFLHITIAGQFLEQQTYFDLQDKFLEIKERYKLHHISTQPSSWIQKNEL